VGPKLTTAAPSCFPAAQSGAFTGAQLPNVSGKWSGTIQPCNLDTQTGVCTITGQPADVAASLTQDNLRASVAATYTVMNSAAFTTGTISELPSGLFSGHTWRATWMDTNGARFTMNSQFGQGGSLTGVVTDVFLNNYLLKLSRQGS
jgi:hypothetical protein